MIGEGRTVFLPLAQMLHRIWAFLFVLIACFPSALDKIEYIL